jgi:hypothetical protein
MATIIPNFVQGEKQNTEAHPYAVKTGTAASITVGDIVIEDTTNAGYVKAVGTAEITSEDTIVGVATTTSTETASADGVVMVNDELATQVFEAKTVGTPAQAQVNTIATITSAADGTQKVNEDSTSGGVAKIIDFDADKGTVKVKLITDGLSTGARLASIQQTVALADFTDGGSTSGTVVLRDSIPVGALAVQTLIDDVTGFAGDTSAVMTVGDGTDADRYNTGTPNVFATATAVAAGAVSGTALHTTAVDTVTVTVTSAADFSSVTAGQATITIFYYTAA